MFTNNLKIAYRNLLRRRSFTAINVAGLSLGMAAAILAFLWVENEYGFDQYHPVAEQTYRLNTDLRVSADEVWHWATTPLPLVKVVQEEVPEAMNATTMTANMWPVVNLERKGQKMRCEKYGFVDGNWFEMFSYQFLDGTAEGFQQNLHSAILTQKLAEKIFGKADVVGESFRLDTLDFTVQAVVENRPANSSFDQEMLLPLSFLLSNEQRRQDAESWNNFNFLTLVQLRPGSDLAAVNEKLTTLTRKYKEAEDDNVSILAQPLSEVHFDETRAHLAMLTGSQKSANVVGIIGLVILFLACVNYVSLTTAQAGMRTKEVGVRKIIGAGGQQIFKLLFSENLITALVSLALAIGFVQLALPYFNEFAEQNFDLGLTNPMLWMVAGGTLGTTLLLSGVYPALFLTDFSPGQFLRGQNFLKMKNTAFRKGLVVAQFAITTGLIIGAIVIYQQQEYIRHKDLGYDRSQVFEFNVPYSKTRQDAVKAIQQSLTTVPSVVATAASNMSVVNMNSTHSGSIDYEGKPDDFEPVVYQASVDASFSELMQLKMADGRWFQPDNEADMQNVVLNEAAVRFMKIPEPVVGQKFSFQGKDGQVVGIVKDFHYLSLRSKIAPLVLQVYPPSNSTVYVKTTAGKASEAIAAAEKAWEARYPNMPFEYRFLDDAFNQMYKTEDKNAALFKLLAGLAVFISCLGLFGLAVFSTQQRVKEIGVRKVLGASVPSLVGLLSKDFVTLVILSLVIAAPLAWYFMDKWLQDFAYRIDIQWTVFALAGMAAVGVAFLTVSFQSIKAALANPVKSLRSE
ncbi:MAG: ABC transporter permease [Saprospiraceae bacterium]|nr:ABC transporter permease [Saprospiraceae bacterium]